MPRAKVVPEERQRVQRACQNCQNSKKRCDGQLPCGLCSKHDRQDSCVYVPSANENARAAPYPTPRHRSSLQGVERPSVTQTLAAGHNGAARSEAGTGNEPGSKQPQYITNQMMVNSKGEKVFLGETAALSFLQFLRQLLRQHIGPSTFTDVSSNVMLEAQSPEANATELVDDIDLQRNYIQYYLAATSGILALHTQANVDELLRRVSTFDSRYRLDQAEALLVVAIGAQARNRRLDSNYARAYFDRGRQLSFEGMLENPSHNLVRLFLLMSFYMLGACQRNAACLYLGISAKTASIIGLHDENQYQGDMDMDQRLRFCTWKSLKVVDILVNAILGRPTSFPPVEATIGAKAIDHRHIDSILDASFQLSTMIEASTTNSKANPSSALSTAETMLRRVRSCMNTMPAGFRSIKTPDLASLQPDELAGMIGNVHLACIYYFAVMLLTRPYFMAAMVLRMGTNDTTIKPASSSQMAEACIDAAMFMSTMAKNALTSGILLANMVFLKAWMFLAGLILGFAICTQVDERLDVENAFINAREVLAMLSASSPQAQEYYDILGLFAEAIRRYREQARVKKSQKTKKYVDEVLKFDSEDVSNLDLTPNSSTHLSSDMGQIEVSYGDMLSNFDPSLGDTAAFAELGQFAAQINDFFPFDYESLGLGFEASIP